MDNLSRRDFLKASGFIAAAFALWRCTPREVTASVQPAPTPAPTLATPLSADDATTLTRTLRRITFGPLPNEVARARAIGLEAFILEQLNPESIPEPDILAPFDFETLEMNAGELLRVDPPGRPIGELMGATLARAVFSPRQLYEKMVVFWSDHFNIYIRKGIERALKPVDDRLVIRPHALGRFHDLLSASAHSPAMLYYLDNASSTKEKPNENYARELLELHTLGVDGGYTHQDIVEVARALTGWSITRPRRFFGGGGEFVFRPRLHDTGPKTILGQSFPAGQGVEDGEQLLDLLSHHPSTARFISTKLVRRFVADEPPEDLVTRATQTFQETDGDIAEVMRTILTSDELRASLGGKLKRPFEYLVSALRQTQAEIEPNRALFRYLTMMGQPLFHWPTPDGYPDVAAAWMGTGSLLARWNFALALAFNTIPGVRVDWDVLAGEASAPEGALDTLSDRFLGAPLPEEARSLILDFLNTLDAGFVLPALGALLLASPYFQYH
ncbi:MAG: DUF1800 domain-containing protein [Anaerolineae bacterium]|nr:MAG: DUF1800 domain-containing protein [Anaerolineae bacterium]